MEGVAEEEETEFDSAVFTADHARYNRPGYIVTFGSYYGTAQALDAAGALRYVRERGGGDTGYGTAAAAAAAGVPVAEMRRAVQWTRWITALNRGRKWALNRLFEKLDPMLEPNIAVAVVPSHDPFLDDPPLRQLARLLASTNGRVDATGCLVRHTKIKRIVWGGPSYRSLHEQTISIVHGEIIAGRAVLLLDDIARSGASLRACETMLYRAGAKRVQPAALGRVNAPS